MSVISLLSACRLLLDANRMGALMTNEQIMIRSRQASTGVLPTTTATKLTLLLHICLCDSLILLKILFLKVGILCFNIICDTLSSRRSCNKCCIKGSTRWLQSYFCFPRALLLYRLLCALLSCYGGGECIIWINRQEGKAGPRTCNW